MTEWQSLSEIDNLVVALDLDGTLVPFAPTPRDARIDGDTAALLDELARSPGVTLGIVTGRPRDLVEDLPPRFPNVVFAAEHGVWRCANGVWEAALPPVPQLDEITRSLQGLAALYQGALIERKSCSVCLHWRMVARGEHEAIATAAEATVDEWLETNQALERLPVIEGLEIRHRSAHKGVAVAWLRGRAPKGAVMLAIGDDITDEDMFASLREGDLGVLVSREPRRTEAKLRLPDPPAVHRFIRWLVDGRARRTDARSAPDIAVAVPATAAGVGVGAPKLVIVSNRLPNTGTEGGKQREVGGLVSALLPVFEQTAGMWLGWSGAERDPGLRVRVEHGQPFSRAQFDYPPTWRQRFYGGFCNQSLWPLMHGFATRVRYSDDEWASYVDANRAYAQIVAQVGGREAEIWVQDFHLMLVGRELVERHGHTGKIGFFLHVPFPPRDVFETLPWSRTVIEALLKYDLIGVQCERWRENLIATVRGFLGNGAVEDAERRVQVVPVGIDAKKMAEAAAAGPSPELGSLESMLGGRKLILGVDRLDYSKGIPERLESFACMLETYPEWRGRVSFVQVSVPTRSDVPDYAQLRARVESLVGRINGQYGEADWTPVRYLYRSYDQATLARLYRAATVALVTPLRDGMNLVAKEFIAAQDATDPGVLVLSRFCGAVERMVDAVVTNPYHVDGVAADLDRALRIPLEARVTAHAKLLRVVEEDTATAWAERFRALLHRPV